MYELPTEIEISGVQYHIRNDGDFRMVLDIFSILGDEELTDQEKTISSLIIFYDGFNEIDDLNNFPDIEAQNCRITLALRIIMVIPSDPQE